MNWKTIDKLEAIVPGADTYRGELCEFDVRFGRASTPLSLTGTNNERFRIENKQYDIAVEAPTLNEAKELLREKLAASDNFTGTWKLWMQVDVSGGFDREAFQGEDAVCRIGTRFVLELTSVQERKTRKRHMTMRAALPTPFTGEFWKPETHKELSQLREGPAYKKEDFNKDEVWVEATPELVEAVRTLQRRLGESGDKVIAALSKPRFVETLEAVRLGTEARLIGTSVLQPEADHE